MATTRISKGDFALRLFALYSSSVIVAAVIAFVLSRVFGLPTETRRMTLPVAFHVSTCILIVGSWQLHRASRNVRVEKQKPFRQALTAALVLGILFVGVQSYGIWCLTSSYPNAQNTQTNAHGFVFVFVALHALHFTVAMMFLSFVTLHGLLDRYDHEYYWGVTVCEWFWHVLGIVWLAILAVFEIAV